MPRNSGPTFTRKGAWEAIVFIAVVLFAVVVASKWHGCDSATASTAATQIEER